MYDYGARFYDPATGRWFTPDALAESYYDQSLYVYTLNNPIYYIDPDGNAVEMCCDSLIAFAATMVDNTFGTDLRGSLDTGSASYGSGVRSAHAVSQIGGAFLQAKGMFDTGAGGAGMATSTAITVSSGGTATVVTGPGFVASAALTLTGIVEMVSGTHLKNMSQKNASNDGAKYNRSNSSSSPSSSERPRSTKHTDNRHVSKKKYPSKSKYKNPAQRKKLENRTMKTEGVKQRDGRVRYDKDYGRKIGTRGETSHRVIVDPKKKKIVTSFPQGNK